jgi:hypothetical protein
MFKPDIGNHWVHLAGAVLSVQVDATEVLSLTTDAVGMALVDYPTIAVSVSVSPGPTPIG